MSHVFQPLLFLLAKDAQRNTYPLGLRKHLPVPGRFKSIFKMLDLRTAR